MGFGKALTELVAGEKLTRTGVLHPDGSLRWTGWNGKNMYIEMQVPDENSKMTLPYIYMFTATEELVPWTPSQTDLFANDWEVVTE